MATMTGVLAQPWWAVRERERESCVVALRSLSSRAPHNGAAVWSAMRQGAGAQSK